MRELVFAVCTDLCLALSAFVPSVGHVSSLHFERKAQWKNDRHRAGSGSAVRLPEVGLSPPHQVKQACSVRMAL